MFPICHCYRQAIGLVESNGCIYHVQKQQKPGQFFAAYMYDMIYVHVINSLTQLKMMALFSQPVGDESWPIQNPVACPGYVWEVSS